MKHFIFTCIFLCACAFVKAQSPQLISYQAVARDLTGKVLSEKPISVQVEILRGSNAGTDAGTVVYTETHELTTTKTGTINLLIGGGDKVGENDFSNIDWSQSPYFLRLGLKQEKESEYTEVVNTQMVSVPYALYAEKAGSVVNEGEEDASVSETDYAIIPVDMQYDPVILYTALAGETIEFEADYEVRDKETEQVLYYSADGDGLEFSLVYLTGTDLGLTAEIEKGFNEWEKFCSASSRKGRHYSFSFEIPPSLVSDSNLLSTKLLIKDKDGNVISEYPFSVRYTIREHCEVVYE